LLSQQSALEMAADSLANAFSSAFANASSGAALNLSGPSLGMLMGYVSNSYGTNDVVARSSGGGTYNININPGLVTDPVGLGKEVVNAIQRYETNNGRVFVRA